MADCVLGVDGGGTKTLAAICSMDGTILGMGKSGCSNFQSCGEKEAHRQLALAIEQVMKDSGVSPGQIKGACYGISGADRKKDFDTVRRMIEPINPCAEFTLVNDTIIALRAGTDDGVGIALIAGTGANAIGRNAKGKTLQVGGMGALTGDYGSAGQLAEAAIVAAFKGLDGRAEATVLSEMFCRHLELSHLEDIIEYEFFDLPRGPLEMGSLAPLVFEAASRGDFVASRILQEAGREIGAAAMIVMDGLFDKSEMVTLVFGGSVFTKGVSSVMIDTIKQHILEAHSLVRFVKLEDEPVVGALGFAFDHLGWTINPKIADNMRSAFR